jgi:sec-independent protein translocase protein TatA
MYEGILQPAHLILILVIVLIIFGPGKLPNVGRALGQSIRELRDNASMKEQPALPDQPTSTTYAAPPASTPQASSPSTSPASQPVIAPGTTDPTAAQ